MRRITLMVSCLAIAGFTVIEITGGVEARGSPRSTLAGNERAARAFAVHELSAVRMPAGSAVTATDPALSGVLAKPQSRPGIGPPRLVDLHRFWRVPGSPAALIEWLRHHQPAGSRLSSWGRGGGRDGPSVWSRGYSFRAVPAGIYETELDFAIGAGKGGGTAVRVDSFAAALVPRPAWERVPAAVTQVVVEVRRYDGTHAYPIATVTDAAVVRRLVAVFNRSGIVQPGPSLGCGLITGATPELSFRFVSATNAEIADASESGCAGLKFAVGGRSGAALLPHVDLTRVLWSEHVLPVCSSLSVDAEPLTRTPGPAFATLPFQIRDTASNACGLRGYPGVRLGTAAGALSIPRTERIPVGHPVTPPVVLLDPSWPATTSISWPTRHSCRSVPFTHVQLGLPGVSRPFTVRLRQPVNPCGGTITIAPI
jgi:hypothetical protein